MATAREIKALASDLKINCAAATPFSVRSHGRLVKSATAYRISRMYEGQIVTVAQNGKERDFQVLRVEIREHSWYKGTYILEAVMRTASGRGRLWRGTCWADQDNFDLISEDGKKRLFGAALV